MTILYIGLGILIGAIALSIVCIWSIDQQIRKGGTVMQCIGHDNCVKYEKGVIIPECCKSEAPKSHQCQANGGPEWKQMEYKGEEYEVVDDSKQINLCCGQDYCFIGKNCLPSICSYYQNDGDICNFPDFEKILPYGLKERKRRIEERDRIRCIGFNECSNYEQTVNLDYPKCYGSYAVDFQYYCRNEGVHYPVFLQEPPQPKPCDWTKLNYANYKSLISVLDEAIEQASQGKGKERHASGEPFEQQPICQIARQVGLGYPLGQAVKKIYESQRLDKEAAVAELLGSINYLAGAIIVIREGK